MGLLTFKGGTHPYDGKELSMNSPIEEFMPGNILVFPVSQHIGAPAKPVVAVGDRVMVGDVIADNSEAFVTAPLHSSISGTVKAIEKRYHPSGQLFKKFNSSLYSLIYGW